MPFISAQGIEATYDLVVVGSGFGSLFFLDKAVRLRPDLKILVLEWGSYKLHLDQLRDNRNSDIGAETTYRKGTDKLWNFTIGYGGGTNCWFAQTPRLHPNDFKTQTLYGMGQDWPITYDHIEQYYCEAEDIMSVAGPDDISAISPRSRPYPQPPHRLSTPDEIMKEAQPALHFAIPCARARIATNTRMQCCASSRCNLCPVNAKFTAENGFQVLFDKPNVSIMTGAKVTSLYVEGATVRRAFFQIGGREQAVSAPLFVLGANAIHSVAILLNSGVSSPLTGRGITEQVGFQVEVFLDNVNAFDGGTITTGLNYSLVDGPFRREFAGALVYFENQWRHGLRTEYGRWRQTLPLTIVVEDPPASTNQVSVDRDGIPEVSYRYSEYAARGVIAAKAGLSRVLAPLPVEEIVDRGFRATESHLLSTLRMGRTGEDSVVDTGQIHHRLRNLVVVGSSVFPSCPVANPSLTVAALSLRAADKIFGPA